jgi:hypothetical protein
VVTVTETLHAVVVSGQHRQLGWRMRWHRHPAAAYLPYADWTAWVARGLAGPWSWWVGRGPGTRPAAAGLSGVAPTPAEAVTAAERALVRAATGGTR